MCIEVYDKLTNCIQHWFVLCFGSVVLTICHSGIPGIRCSHQPPIPSHPIPWVSRTQNFWIGLPSYNRSNPQPRDNKGGVTWTLPLKVTTSLHPNNRDHLVPYKISCFGYRLLTHVNQGLGMPLLPLADGRIRSASQNHLITGELCLQKLECQFEITHRIHVWYIYLHLVDFYGKCRYVYHTWMVWVRQLRPYFFLSTLRSWGLWGSLPPHVVGKYIIPGSKSRLSSCS